MHTRRKSCAFAFLFLAESSPFFGLINRLIQKKSLLIGRKNVRKNAVNIENVKVFQRTNTVKTSNTKFTLRRLMHNYKKHFLTVQFWKSIHINVRNTQKQKYTKAHLVNQTVVTIFIFPLCEKFRAIQKYNFQ